MANKHETKSEATQTKTLAVCAPTRKSSKPIEALYPKAIEDIEVIVCNCVVSLYIFVLYINREEACSPRNAIQVYWLYFCNFDKCHFSHFTVLSALCSFHNLITYSVQHADNIPGICCPPFDVVLKCFSSSSFYVVLIVCWLKHIKTLCFWTNIKMS